MEYGRLFLTVIWTTVVLCSTSLPTQSFSGAAGIAIATIFQDEAPYLKEWIEFHRLVGVDHFYLYNNLSSDDYLQVLAPYIGKEVELIDWPYNSQYGDHKGWLRIQKNAYDDACMRSAGVYKWLITIDADEFIFPVEHDTLTEFLRDYDDSGQILVSWLLYGTSHRPSILKDQLLVEQLIMRAKKEYTYNNMVKAIVRPEVVRKYHSAHFADLKTGYTSVITDKTPFIGLHPPVNLYNKVRINHYWTRDESYLSKKIARRIRHGGNPEALIKRASMLNSEEDRAIFKYISRLRAAIIR